MTHWIHPKQKPQVQEFGMANEVALSIRDLHKSYGRHHVLKGVSLELPKGQTLALLGRNGAGKTTLIKSIVGLLKPDQGAIRVCNLDPQSNAVELRRHIGYLAEDQQMFGWMTVEQLIRFVGAFYRDWDHALAAQYLQQLQLEPDKKIKQLSKGNAIRLGLLLALAHRPEVVILDDPALALDPIMRKEFNRDLVAHLQDIGSTILYSSHLLAEVEPVADCIAILHEGKIARYATTNKLREDVKRMVFPTEYASEVLAQFPIIQFQNHGRDASVVVEDAPAATCILQEWEVPYQTVDLNLDEIFEAYVTDRMDSIPTMNTAG